MRTPVQLVPITCTFGGKSFGHSLRDHLYFDKYISFDVHKFPIGEVSRKTLRTLQKLGSSVPNEQSRTATREVKY